MGALIRQVEVRVKALRGIFLLMIVIAGCFADNGVKKEISKAARVFMAIFGVLFVIAEAMELLS